MNTKAAPKQRNRGRPPIKNKKPIAQLQAPLVNMLRSKIIEEGLSLTDFAKKHQIAYSVLTGVLNNIRWAPHSDKENVIKPLARVLSIPPAMVLYYGGQLEHTDFEIEESIEDRIGFLYRQMSQDHSVAAFIPPISEFKKWDTHTQLSFGLLYQLFFNERLLRMAGNKKAKSKVSTGHISKKVSLSSKAPRAKRKVVATKSAGRAKK